MQTLTLPTPSGKVKAARFAAYWLPWILLPFVALLFHHAIFNQAVTNIFFSSFWVNIASLVTLGVIMGGLSRVSISTTEGRGSLRESAQMISSLLVVAISALIAFFLVIVARATGVVTDYKSSAIPDDDILYTGCLLVIAFSVFIGVKIGGRVANVINTFNKDCAAVREEQTVRENTWTSVDGKATETKELIANLVDNNWIPILFADSLITEINRLTLFDSTKRRTMPLDAIYICLRDANGFHKNLENIKNLLEAISNDTSGTPAIAMARAHIERMGKMNVFSRLYSASLPKEAFERVEEIFKAIALIQTSDSTTNCAAELLKRVGLESLTITATSTPQ